MKSLLLIIVGLGVIGLAAHLYLVLRFLHFLQALEARIYDSPRPLACTDLPAIVQAFAMRGMAGDDAPVGHVTLSQDAEMRRARGGQWLPMQACQVIRADQPGFVWTATQKAGPR